MDANPAQSRCGAEASECESPQRLGPWWDGSRIYRTSIVGSSFARQRENLKHGHPGYHRIERPGHIAKTMVPTMATIATTNAAATSLDSKWTPRRRYPNYDVGDPRD